MINVKKEWMKNIPVLHIAKQDFWNEKLPLVFFIHGFGSAKEHNLHYAYLIAEKGFRVILPDVQFHGEREQGYSESELYPRFWEMVIQTIREISVLRDDLMERQLIDPDRIGISGTSMGGIVTNGALVAYNWIKVGVSLMGNPAYVAYAKMQIEVIKKKYPNFLSDEDIQKQLNILKGFDLSLSPEKLANRPLLFWHGAKDPIVPYQHAYKFYESMLPAYEQSKEKLVFILDKNAGHKVSREGVLQTAEWFAQHLTPAVQKA